MLIVLNVDGQPVSSSHGHEAYDKVDASWYLDFVHGVDGDACAYTRFYREIIRPLRSFFGRRSRGSSVDIEDLVQETLVAIHSSRCSFERGRSLSSWVFSIASHKLADFLRARSRYESRRVDMRLDDLCGDEDVRYEEPHINVVELLRSLPAKHRLSIYYTKIRGLSIKETSCLTGMSEASVKVGVHRGIKALGSHLKATRLNLTRAGQDHDHQTDHDIRRTGT
jgi:RNA polymerase sigma-70 factor, ECF subfamily